ncbi:helix-turn-helix domain-containing protein, partial [Micrococcus sp. SIMBA_144]
HPHLPTTGHPPRRPSPEDPMNTPLPFDQDDLSAPARLRLAALELYAERGVEMASVRERAQRAGVAAGLVRHHFGSKAGLT